MDALAKQKVLVVCGPTASGKTALALALSHQFGCEMVSADSMQVYKGLVVGTAAVTPAEAGGIPQHLTGFLPPEEAFSVADYTTAASEAIRGIATRGNLPLVCGGTGLYIQSLIEGIRFDGETADTTLRETLQTEWETLGAGAMVNKLAKVDPAAAERLHPADKKRILRALEQYTLTGQTAEARRAASRPESLPYNALLLGLSYADRAHLYTRIDMRVDTMLAEGLLDEAQTVYTNRESYKTAAQAIGYKEFFPFFAGEAPLAACVSALKQATRNYAKRQLSWFRRMKAIHWLDAANPAEALKEAGNLTEAFLQS